MVEKNCFMKKNHSKVGINTDNDLPLNKPIKFPTLTIIIRCVFQEEGKRLHPQIYLDECLYEHKNASKYKTKWKLKIARITYLMTIW